jgi:hypothetical protein
MAEVAGRSSSDATVSNPVAMCDGFYYCYCHYYFHFTAPRMDLGPVISTNLELREPTQVSFADSNG